MKSLLPLVVALASVLTACEHSSKPPETEPSIRTGGKLQKATEDSLTDYFRTAKNSFNRDGNLNFAEDDALAGADSTTAESSNFSTTTLQEGGVDEADLVKTDGEYIYSIYRDNGEKNAIADSAIFAPENSSEQSQGIRVMRTNGATTEEIKNIPLNSRNIFLSGIYLANDDNDLITLGSGGGNFGYDWFYPPYFSNQTTEVNWINVSDPINANLEHKLSFDGSLLSSRRVGRTLYLMLRHYPEIILANENNSVATSDTSTEDFLPKFQLNSEPRKLSVKVDDCFINTGAANQTADVITLAAIDLEANTPSFESSCYVGSSETVYASTKALYLASTRWDYTSNGNSAVYNPEITTDIHKFSFKDSGFDYRGSAEVGGHLGWLQDRKPYRMSESADGQYLRIITQNEQRSWLVADAVIANTDSQAAPADLQSHSPVMLTILAEDQEKAALKIVSQIPNKSNTKEIGKPGEQLYATRFIGDRAYLVTYRLTDPLYTIDIANPLNPVVKGELEIDGYSDFLFSVGDNLLLGIGKDAIATSESTANPRAGAWYQGVKLSLINVADLNNPVEEDKIVIGKRGTESSALQTPHAVTILRSENGRTRVALPVSLNETLSAGENGPRTYYDYTRSGLFRYEIDPQSKSIIPVTELITHTNSDSSYRPFTSNSRSVIIGDNVHFLERNRFWSQDWAGTSAATGPK